MVCERLPVQDLAGQETSGLRELREEELKYARKITLKDIKKFLSVNNESIVSMISCICYLSNSHATDLTINEPDLWCAKSGGSFIVKSEEHGRIYAKNQLE